MATRLYLQETLAEENAGKALPAAEVVAAVVAAPTPVVSNPTVAKALPAAGPTLRAVVASKAVLIRGIIPTTKAPQATEEEPSPTPMVPRVDLLLVVEAAVAAAEVVADPIVNPAKTLSTTLATGAMTFLRPMTGTMRNTLDLLPTPRYLRPLEAARPLENQDNQDKLRRILSNNQWEQTVNVVVEEEVSQ